MIRYLHYCLLSVCLVMSCQEDIIVEPVPEPAVLLTAPIHVVLNPNEIAPLSALATIQTLSNTVVTMQVNGARPLIKQFDKSQKEHEVIILGLYPDKNNEVIFQLTDAQQYSQSDTIYIQTKSLPEFFPEAIFHISDESMMEPGWTLCDFSTGHMTHLETYPFIIDEDGAYRWFMDLSFPGNLVMPVQQLNNGNILCAYESNIYEYNMLGSIVNEWTIDGFNQHHDIFEKANGNILLAVSNTEIETINDHIIELDRNSGAIIKTWDLREVLDISRTAISFNSTDWLHMNAVWYDETDGGLLISGKHQGVMKVSDNNELQWIMAPHKEWGDAGVNADGLKTNDFLLTAIDANGSAYPEAIQMGETIDTDFDWGWGQHAVMRLRNGDILLFDNGNNRQYDSATEPYSRMVEYKVDPINMTVEQVWSFGQSYGEDLFAKIISDVDELSNTGNRMMTSGITWMGSTARGRIVEVSYPSQQVVFDATLVFKNLNNTSEFIWHRHDIMYRAERISIYR